MSLALPPSSVTSRTRIHAIDFMRVLVVTNVVAVHVIAQLSDGVATGAIGILIHVNREIFIMISAFILTYTYGRRPNLDWRKFFERRYLFILTPYITWTALYALADGDLESPQHVLGLIGGYLLNGRARYQLYFLLIMIQLYLFFPLIRWLLRKTERYHLPIVVGFGVWQLLFTALVQRSWGAYGPLGFWLGNPDIWLGSYLFYIVAGAIAAWHMPELLAFTERHRRRIGQAALGMALIALVVYGVQLAVGMPVDEASTTFQPVTVVESAVFALYLLTAGHHWELRGARGKRWFMYGAAASFGVYLIHPLVIQGLMSLGGTLGLVVPASYLPIGVGIVLALGLGLPLVAAISLLLTELFNRTPLSLPLTGRLRWRAKPNPQGKA